MKTVLAKLVTGWALTGGLLVIAIMLVTTINAGGFALDRIARGFGESVAGLPGYEDFVRLSISCSALMFLPYCQLRKGHVTVDLFVNMFPVPIQIVLDRLWLIVTAALAAFLGYWLIQGMIETANDNALSPILGWAEWPFYIPGVISMALWVLISLSQIFEKADHV